MRESRTFGSVGGEGGNVLAYPAISCRTWRLSTTAEDDPEETFKFSTASLQQDRVASKSLKCECEWASQGHNRRKGAKGGWRTADTFRTLARRHYMTLAVMRDAAPSSSANFDP
jgi:hypothetical protein